MKAYSWQSNTYGARKKNIGDEWGEGDSNTYVRA
jgi:hypothetical protein